MYAENQALMNPRRARQHSHIMLVHQKTQY